MISGIPVGTLKPKQNRKWKEFWKKEMPIFMIFVFPLMWSTRRRHAALCRKKRFLLTFKNWLIWHISNAIIYPAQTKNSHKRHPSYRPICVWGAYKRSEQAIKTIKGSGRCQSISLHMSNKWFDDLYSLRRSFRATFCYGVCVCVCMCVFISQFPGLSVVGP